MNFRLRWCRRLGAVAGAAAVLIVSQPSVADAADSAGQETTTLVASVQNVPDPSSQLYVVWRGHRVSALPFRVRVLNEASPLAYSLDIRRPSTYGDTWTAISLGDPTNTADQQLPQLGVATAIRAQLVARGGAADGQDVAPAGTELEYAARQTAIWALENGLPLNPASVPDDALRSRAQNVLADAGPDKSPPLQPAEYGIDILTRETTAKDVVLALDLTIDPNTHLVNQQNIDLGLDGAVCSLKTKVRSTISLGSDGSCKVTSQNPLPASAPYNVAEVSFHRNAKVISASALWVRATSDPGQLYVSDGAAPPMMTADSATLNFQSTARLDPADYSSPQQLLDKAGTGFLADVPSEFIWIALLVLLWVVTRAGRIADWAGAMLWSRVRKRPSLPQPTVVTGSVIAEGRTVADAVQTALAATGRQTVAGVTIDVLRQPVVRPFGPNVSARVRLEL